MQTHTRTRLEIIVEATMARRVEEMLMAEGVTGFFAVSGREGGGSSGRWRDDGLSGALEKVMIIAVTVPDVAARVMARLDAFFERYPGVCFVSEVGVMRPQRF